MTANGSKVRSYCFTLNNWTHEEYVCLTLQDPRYLVIGKEGKAEGKTPHLQGYIEFKNPRTLEALKAINSRIHWEVRKGTPEQAAVYCKKEGDFAEWGKISRQGKRSDLDEIVEAIDNGAKARDIFDLAPSGFIRYHKGIERAISLQYKHRTGAPEVAWRWGLTGTGKTRFCVEKHPSHYIKDGTTWWDGYEQQEAIIIDDFDGKWAFRDLLRLLDRYTYQGQVKGGFIPINSPFIYITCEFPPMKFWSGNDLAQVLRRITSITEVIGPFRAEQEGSEQKTETPSNAT